MKNRRFSSFIYTRTWSKIFSPLTNTLTHFGKQLSRQNLFGQNEANEFLLPTHSVTNNDETNSNNNSDHLSSPFYPLKTFLGSITSPFLSVGSSIGSSFSNGRQNQTYQEKCEQKERFHSRNSSIYHQLPSPMINDENNNMTSNTTNDNSTIIDLQPVKSSSSEILIDSQIFTYNHFLWIFILTMIYFIWFIFVAGISIIHVIIYLLILVLYLFSDRTRRFILALIIYLVYLLLYDALHLLPNYSVSTVHIRDVYLTEKKLFGIFSNGHLMTLNEFFRLNHRPVLDVLSGICYLNWIPIPIIYSFYLYRYKSKRDYIDFALTFLLTNILGFVIYYIVPAAPPWYIELYGFTMNMKAPGHPAGFIHFDQITGVKVFSTIYSKNANVFAAIPSLHAAYPLLTVLYGSLSKKLWLQIGFVFFTLGVWFSAVYSRHHYVLDVLAGGTCAVTAYILYRLFSRIPAINRLLSAYSKVI